MATQDALAYHEPGIETVLIQTGFLLALNVVNTALDKIIYCGLIGQLFIGMAWGIPGGNLLELGVQKSIQQLGYLGLLLLVYEGGLSTSFSQLKSNFVFSALVAVTGVGVPMGLSFILMHLLAATPLQAFAAGAALSSTSIGTTFTILSTTGLAKTRLGVVLGSAAMMDDVMGLVMVQIISNLGGDGGGNGSGSSGFDPVIVIRPILVAFGFAIGLLLICRFGVARAVHFSLARNLHHRFPDVVHSSNFAFVAHMGVLIGLVAGATYAGTSGLFAAYLAGAGISWFDELLATATSTGSATEGTEVQRDTSQRDSTTLQNIASMQEEPTPQRPTGEQIFEQYCKEPLKRILSPLFFASIGFSIPITKMFRGEVVWRGVVYSVLMMFSKMITGLWLIQLRLSPPPILEKLGRISKIPFTMCTSPFRKGRSDKSGASSNRNQNQNSQAKTAQKEKGNSADKQATKQDQRQDHGQDQSQPPTAAGATNPSQEEQSHAPISRTTSSSNLPPKPRSLYPASILGLAMVARGEIGYLIASLAETDGIFAKSSSSSSQQQSSGSSEMYLVVVWAITLCTVIGPICVGTLVKRVRKMQTQRVQPGGVDPLGTWGVTS